MVKAVSKTTLELPVDVVLSQRAQVKNWIILWIKLNNAVVFVCNAVVESVQCVLSFSLLPSVCVHFQARKNCNCPDKQFLNETALKLEPE